MPQDNIQRAIKKGTGELPGVHYEEHTYEGYGAAGVAIMADVLTDNKNRTVAELRKIFSKNNGNMAESGCVNWMFHKKGLIFVDSDKVDEEKLMSIVIDAGAEDIKTEDKTFEIVTEAEDFENVKNVLSKNKIEFSIAEITMIPETTLKVEGEDAWQVIKLMEELDDHDDIQKTYANFDIAEKDLAKTG
jgi:YebC/PmpR family DNA-binding regulatory protein